VQQPKSPTPEPSVTLFESQRDDGLVENVAQDRAVIATFNNTRQSDGQLKVIQITKANIHGIFQITTKDKERGRIF
jgi:hypothetical protein